MLDLTRLKVFRAVASYGSFTKAAEAMGYSQPSISHQVAQLERELSAQLFERQPRRVALTPAGEVFLRHVQAVLIRAQQPGSELRLAEADPPVSVPALLAGEHDLAVTYDYPVLGAAADLALELEPLCLDHMVVALPPGHGAASSGRVTL